METFFEMLTYSLEPKIAGCGKFVSLLLVGKSNKQMIPGMYFSLRNYYVCYYLIFQQTLEILTTSSHFL